MRPWQLFPPLLVGSQEDEISKLLSPSIYYGDCYAIGGILLLIYAALWALIWRGKGFICLPSKTAFYCVTKWKRQARNGLFLTCLFLHPVWQLPYFSLLLDTVLWVAIIQQPCFIALILRWLWKAKQPFLFGKLKWDELNQEANNGKKKTENIAL